MKPAIRVEHLTKRYRLGANAGPSGAADYSTLRESIAAGVARACESIGLGRRAETSAEHARDFWALDGVTFEIEPGEVIGVIGRNGAGKSTLLKILSRITPPTSGRVEVRGRVGSLLEVGTGFHPELTGRENIYLNGSILGMSRREIARKFDEIVEFSGVERFLDTPVKRYSSGMYVRLAFSVAAHLDPEILLVDEVLSVGDAAFQKKCMRRIGEVAREGRTVLFVTHNMGAVSSLCGRAVWLEAGRVYDFGEARSLVNRYLAESVESADRWIDLGRLRKAPSSSPLVLRAIEWCTDVPLCHGEPATFRIHYECTRPVESAAFGLGIASVEGVRILTFDSDDGDVRRDLTEGETGWVEMSVDELPLVPGTYALDVGARSGDRHGLDYLGNFAQVQVVPGERTPPVYVCYPGAGVRLGTTCRWSGHEPAAWAAGPGRVGQD